MFPLPQAYADNDSSMTALELQEELKRTEDEYNQAQAEADKAAKLVEEQEQQVKEIQALIPDQKERSAKATRELYKMHQQSVSLVTMLLSSDSFNEFVNGMEYVTRINDSNYAEITRLNNLQNELSAKTEELKKSKEEADAHVKESKRALDAAKAAKAESDRREEENKRIAEEAAKKAKELEQSTYDNTQGTASSGSSSNAGSSNNGNSGNASGGGNGSGAGSGNAGTGSASGSSAEEAFIAKWAPRINAFMAGSPMAGTGRTFAKAAYKYNVDPRVSPAISLNESGRGAQCFRPYNAWGWMTKATWSSWDEAIDAHIRGFSKGYGYTLTLEGAYKYWAPQAAVQSYNNVMKYMSWI